VLEKENRIDVNRYSNPLLFGFRLTTTFFFDIITITDQVYLANIVNRLGRNGWDTELSLDAGASYVPVELSGYSGPDPLKNKRTAGAGFSLELKGRDLIDEVPYLAGVYADPDIAEPLMTLPPPSRFWKNKFRMLEGPAGTEDVMYVCLKTSSESPVYAWIPFVAGGG